jgi:hypothetical protein
MSENKELAKGRVIIEVFQNREPHIVFEGTLDHMNLQAMTFKLKQEFLGNYLAKQREIEIANIGKAKIKAAEDLNKSIQEATLKKERDERLKAQAMAKVRAEEAAKKKEVLAANQKLEAERILKKENERKLAQEGDKDAVKWASDILNNKATKTKEIDNGTGIKF